MQDYTGRVAVITGAGSGFGREFARIAAARGMRLVLADIAAGPLEDTAAPLRAAGAEVLSAVVDVAHDAEVAALAERTCARFGGAHLLFNNAGVASGGYLWENTDRDWEWVLGVNLMGVVHGIRHFVPRMMESVARGEPGHVVNTASMAGWLNAPLMGIYNASKHAVVAVTESLHHDLRAAGSELGVSLLCPAFVPTGIAQSHRHRPKELANSGGVTASQRMAQAASEKAVGSGRLSAEEVAQQTFAAIEAGRFYVFTHPRILPSVEARFRSALAGQEPADPFAAKPELRPGGAV
jgi:NAD(P)-dependent dehydrogenase (short-subunit alcohol dehydrogenase family)